MGRIKAFMSCTKVSYHGEGCDDYTEEHGWVDPSWSRTEIYESRNDVAPMVDEDVNSADLADYIRDVMEKWGPWESNGNGLFYRTDGDSFGDREELEDPGTYSYAIHFHVKRLDGNRGWVEDDWCPIEDGGMSREELRVSL